MTERTHHDPHIPPDIDKSDHVISGQAPGRAAIRNDTVHEGHVRVAYQHARQFEQSRVKKYNRLEGGDNETKSNSQKQEPPDSRSFAWPVTG